MFLRISVHFCAQDWVTKQFEDKSTMMQRLATLDQLTRGGGTDSNFEKSLEHVQEELKAKDEYFKPGRFTLCIVPSPSPPPGSHSLGPIRDMLHWHLVHYPSWPCVTNGSIPSILEHI